MNFLFDENHEQENLLPYDGTVVYYGIVFTREESDHFFNVLLKDIDWKNDEAIIFGRKIITKRKAAWYGEEQFSYTYSGVTKHALPWTEDLLTIKSRVEATTGETYNSCLLNLYHDGSEGMAWHSDGEKDLKKHGAIASVSFGVERMFAFKHKRTQEKRQFSLQPGSVLVMKDETQDFWLHRLPPTTKVSKARINLTFRTIENHI